MECSICYDKLVGGSTPDKAVVTTQCGHLFHDKCIKDHINKINDDNKSKQPAQRSPPKCPLCMNANKLLTLDNVIKIHLEIENSGINEQLLMTHISDINIKLDNNDKKHTEMFQELLASIATLSDSFKSFQAQNEQLSKENFELRQGGSSSPAADSAAMKAKDFMIANLQKEIGDLKNKRAETTREMNAIREQINTLKLAAKGEKPAPKPEPKNHAITLKFDDLSDKLIIE